MSEWPFLCEISNRFIVLKFQSCSLYVLEYVSKRLRIRSEPAKSSRSIFLNGRTRIVLVLSGSRWIKLSENFASALARPNQTQRAGFSDLSVTINPSVDSTITEVSLGSERFNS